MLKSIMTVNMDIKTGIHYGVIQHDVIGQYWYEDSESEYGKPICPECFNELDESSEYGDESNIDELYYCSKCDLAVNEYCEDIYPESPINFYYLQNGYKCYQSYDDPDIFIEDSPYYTLCNFCSPCAPNAGYITDQDKNGIKAYCFGHDWFEDGIAPYKVFDVLTDKEIKPDINFKP